MLKFFRIPFATSGDRTAIPDAVDVNGYVSFTEGYGGDYQLANTDPDSKNIERDKMNDLFYEVTTALQEQQSQGVPDFITSVLNGGTAYSYDENALVRWTDGDLYLSLAAANTADPTDATKWALLPTAARIQQMTYNSAVASGTVDAITAAFVPALASLAGQFLAIRVAGANTSTTPTFAPDGLVAKTIVKGNNLPLAAGDLPGAGAWAYLKHDVVLDKWVLLNPASIGGRQVAQIQESFSGAIQTGATPMVWDDTIPQSIEGDQYYSVTITPQNAASRLEVDVLLNIAHSAASCQLVGAVFLDSETDARAAGNFESVTGAYQPKQLSIKYSMTSGSTSAMTFKVRAGGNAAGTTNINGNSNARKLGGVLLSGIKVTEYLP